MCESLLAFTFPDHHLLHLCPSHIQVLISQVAKMPCSKLILLSQRWWLHAGVPAVTLLVEEKGKGKIKKEMKTKGLGYCQQASSPLTVKPLTGDGRIWLTGSYGHKGGSLA